MKARIPLKAISVNQAWQGRRYKSPLYKKFQQNALMMMPKGRLPDGKLKITFIFGFSTSLSDLDNPFKPIIDTLQKKYQFNDRDIYEIHAFKQVVKKGKDFFEYKIESI